MRKAQKQQIESLIALLFEAHQEIKYTIENGTTGLALDLLAQCQQSAIAAENMICAQEGEEHKTISYLESYCDALFQVYEAVQNGQALDNVNEWLQEDWEAIQQSVQEDIVVRKEVVFLPYKASMWDSLESVWKAADEDPACDAYVVPIPYYDKNADHSFREFHYEGDQYPGYVPITDYKTYDFAKRRPDIVFIHNPYDQYNYVTSIHPEFYSKNLKKYTDKLVYIPYFVLNEMKLEQIQTNDEAEEKMNSFCIQPGVLNADRVIVQSEDMKQIYVELLTKYAGEHTRSSWEEKVLGLGSPKLDKVNKTSAEDFEIPEEWKPVLYKADGSRRKVILYNTSVTALLEHQEAMLAKMSSVLRTFYENREEIALLWRPHPLIKATIESMAPNLWVEYRKLVNEYRSASWGIYDDTSDLNRALELADAYYGDPSSLVKLCQERGMWVQGQDVTTEGDEGICNFAKLNVLTHPGMTYAIRKNEFLYYFAWNCNAFMQINLETGEVQYLLSLPEEEKHHMALPIDTYRDLIILASNQAACIYVYDTKAEKLIKIAVEGCAEQILSATRGIRVQNKVYYFPTLSKNLICLDLHDFSATKDAELYQAYCRLERSESPVFCAAEGYEYNGKAYIAIWDKGYVAECQLESKSYTYYKVDGISSGFVNMVGVENKLYLLNREKKIVQWNIATKSTEQIWDVEWKAERDFGRVQVGMQWENTIYFMGICAAGVIPCAFGIKLDIETKKTSLFTYEEEFGLYPAQNEEFSFVFCQNAKDGRIYFVSSKQRLFCYNLRMKQGHMLELKYRADKKAIYKKRTMLVHEKTTGTQCFEYCMQK